MYNSYLVIPFAVWLIAQTMKFAIAAAKGKVDFRYLYGSGGMPSVHSAVVCSLATTSFLIDGPESKFFGFTALFAAIVMYDSFGVRRSSGEQAIALNMLISSLATDKIKLLQPTLKLREILGHKPAEVAAGAFLGVFLGALFNIDKLQRQVGFLISAPIRPEFLAYAIFFFALLVAGVMTKLITSWKYRKSQAMHMFGKQILISTQTLGWIGLIFAFAEYEKLAHLSWRLWPILVLAAFIVWSLLLALRFWSTLPIALSEEREEARRRKWFSFKKRPKKRRK